ncbi:L-serine ammonia-lyase, iron-sulfur-dependent, subunit alpha [Clostridium cylindrosporum]|uniref:L-serine dehydratase n=1 Tax=Clostridium cylindrosporum DSM 605 TaxID=1121307 RepID=A0A0J8D4U4_CLOCY|nr:L-serine ammonia-lyase, iron-sulfur-dependent, subunit alpha [Clostridium cylindrosporum]KMT20837.1 putative L-serine dehydratase, alpha chain [Clostridium cylindrosporum DSM 605]
MYTTGKELLEMTKEKNCKISDLVLEYEAKLHSLTTDEINEKMKNNLHIMVESANKGLNEAVKSVSGLIGGDAKRTHDYATKKTLCGETINKAMARALSCSEVNAAMGKIVAAPTAGSCGILPAAVITAAEVLGASEEDMVRALFTASGIGQIIVRNATVAGAEGGCQAECGSAAAMSAAAIVEMAGGTPEMSFNAACIAIKNVLGLVCDPIAGLVEAPCAKRNSSGVVNALTSADLALAGVKSIVPFDEVVEAMYEVGKALPHTLRETALGGMAATPTGIKLRKEILGE